MTRWYVRTWFREQGQLVHLDEGPFDLWLAEVVLADIGRDASIARGLGRTQVERALLVHVHDCYEVAERQKASPLAEPWNEGEPSHAE